MYELWAWLCSGDCGGTKEGVIAGMIPGAEYLGPMPLQHRKKDLVTGKMRMLAEHHRDLYSCSVRLAHLVEVSDAE